MIHKNVVKSELDAFERTKKKEYYIFCLGKL